MKRKKQARKANYSCNTTRILKRILTKQGEESLLVIAVESSFLNGNRVLATTIFFRKELKFCIALFHQIFLWDDRLTSHSSLQHQQPSEHTWVNTSTELHMKKGI